MNGISAQTARDRHIMLLLHSTSYYAGIMLPALINLSCNASIMCLSLQTTIPVKLDSNRFYK